MKLSELIERAQRILDQDGDLIVYYGDAEVTRIAFAYPNEEILSKGHPLGYTLVDGVCVPWPAEPIVIQAAAPARIVIG